MPKAIAVRIIPITRVAEPLAGRQLTTDQHPNVSNVRCDVPFEAASGFLPRYPDRIDGVEIERHALRFRPSVVQLLGHETIAARRIDQDRGRATLREPPFDLLVYEVLTPESPVETRCAHDDDGP